MHWTSTGKGPCSAHTSKSMPRRSHALSRGAWTISGQRCRRSIEASLSKWSPSATASRRDHSFHVRCPVQLRMRRNSPPPFSPRHKDLSWRPLLNGTGTLVRMLRAPYTPMSGSSALTGPHSDRPRVLASLLDKSSGVSVPAPQLSDAYFPGCRITSSHIDRHRIRCYPAPTNAWPTAVPFY